MTTLGQDLKYGLRMLRSNPGVTFVMVITLALAIGANTAIFSVVYGVLLRPLPYPKPHQIVSVSELAADGHPMNFADPNFDDVRASNHSLTGLAEYDWIGTATVSGGSGPTRTGVAFVSRDFLQVMGVQPVLGRGFAPEDQHPGTALRALAGYGYWRQHLGGSTDLAAFKLKTQGYTFSIAGVLPPGFAFPNDTQLWFPREWLEHLPSRSAHNWHVVGRLRDGVSVAQARSDLGGIAHRLKQQYGSDIDMTDARVVPLRESLTGDVRAALLVLLGAVGFLLLVACANLANLQLSQAVAREHEFAVRAALGAGRGRLTRQLLAESALLWLAGGLLGVLVAEWGIQGLMALAPPNLPRLGEVALDFPVLFFAFGISVLIPLSLVVLTAAGATSGDPQRGLAASGRGTSGSLHTQRVSRLIVAGQLAITLTLLAGTVLLGRSLLRLLSLDPGFRTANIVSLDFDLPARHAPGPPFRAASFVNTLFDRLRSIPGIHEVGGTTDLPLTGNFVSDGTFLIVDKPPRSMVDFERLMHTVPTGHADYCIASEGYFGALGIRLISGRLFDDHDTADAPHVAVISESLARATWPKQSPLGKTVEFGNMDGDLRLLRIVGVVADVRDRNLGIPPAPTIYSDYRQRLQGGNNFTVVIHTGVRPATVLATARKIVHDLDPDMAPRFRSFQEVFSESLATRRFNLIILAFFAGTALLLAAAGIYGVMAYWVARRTQEIGIRMALGAKRRDVLRLVVGQGLALALLGITTGMVGAFWLTRSMASLLYEIRPTDPASLAEASVLLLIVALLANLIPARRAAKVNPVVALRDQ